MGVIIEVEEGLHTISLSGEQNFNPNSKDVNVPDNMPFSPVEVDFEEN